MQNNRIESLPLAGNPAIHRQLSGGRLNHAYIISGHTGSGRHLLARWIEQSLVCTAPGHRPCGVCSGCRKAAQGIHPDLITVPRLMENGKVLSAERARAYRTDAFVRPNEAERKVFVFEEADYLTEQNQNILLKVVEDGPAYCAFLFIAENAESLLQTIRSRCEELKLTPVELPEALAWLRQHYPGQPEEELLHAVNASGGFLGEAAALLDGMSEENPSAEEDAEAWCLALAAEDEAGLAEFMATREKLNRADLSAVLSRCGEKVHSALLVSVGAAPRCEGESVEQLAALSRETLLRLTDLLREAKQRLEGNAGIGHLLGWLTVSAMELLNR